MNQDLSTYLATGRDPFLDQFEKAAQVEKSGQGAEGTNRGPFSMLGELGNWFPISGLEDGWHRNIGFDRESLEYFGPIFACVATISQDLARVEIILEREKPDGSRDRVTNKSASRVFKKPNAYQTRSDFILNFARSLLLTGNAYAVCTRNDRGEVDSLHLVPPRHIHPYIADGEIFYRFSDQPIEELTGWESDRWFPARDVLHVRLFTPRHPLIGESPIKAAIVSASTGLQINQHTDTFFGNMSRPSGIFSFPGRLGTTTGEQETAIKRIKERFMQLTQGHRIGEPLVLQDGGDWSPITMSAVDAELIASYKLTERQVAQVFKIPSFLLGDIDKAQGLDNVESILRFYTQTCLGFYVEHMEQAFAAFFNVANDERVTFDIENAMLRADMEIRFNSYAKGVQNGIIAPNEARRREGLPPAKDGDEPRVQQQLVPLSFGTTVEPSAGPGVPPAAGPAPEPEPTEEEKAFALYTAKKAIEKAMAA